jgi:hypothetical protein
MTTLKQAISDGQLVKFVKEHKRDPKGDFEGNGWKVESSSGNIDEAQFRRLKR